MVAFDGCIFDVDLTKGALIVASHRLGGTMRLKRLRGLKGLKVKQERNDEYTTWQLIVLNQ